MAIDPSLMPQGIEHPTVEDVYHHYWGKVGGVGRLRRTFSLFAGMRQMLELQVKNQNPGLTGAELTWRTAKRMYSSNAATLRLLDSVEQKNMTTDDFPETIERLLPLLIELGLRFHFTGGIAASYYGDPRFTQDLDLVIDLANDRPETNSLLNRLSSGYFIDLPAAKDAIARHGLFQAIDERSMVKIDFHVGEKISGELERGARREISPGLMAPLVSKEDAILSKLLWIQQGSHKSRHDVIEMLKRDEDLNRGRLRERATTLGLHDLLAELERDMREARDQGPQPRSS
jgi:Nucleotidyl transferase AbiEii toxin, Type IV TA system